MSCNVIIIGGVACGPKTAARLKRLRPDADITIIEKGDVLLLDVRTPDEFQTMQLPYDVLHIPLGALRSKAAELPKDRDILAFCKISLRGFEAQRILNAAGFNRIQFIEGGIVGWPFEVKMLK